MKQFHFFWLLVTFFIGSYSNAQSDSTEIQQSGYFLTFVKKVYLNPTVFLRTQAFKENTNLGFVALPDNGSATMNSPTGFEKGMQKVIRFLMQSDGGIRFYFNPDSTAHPFKLWATDNLWCKFNETDKDSIDYYLNHLFADGNLSMTNALRFETTIDQTLDYIEKCLNGNPQECAEKPENETTEINTKPLSISLHNRANSKYDIDEKQYDQLVSHYAKAKDVFTQEDWYAPAKLLVANEEDEPVAIAIHSNEGDFLKQNIKIEVIKLKTVLPILPNSTEDSLFLLLPKTLPTGDPVEVKITYKSPKDSLTYVVGFFMVHVMERQTMNVVLLPANGFAVSSNFKDSVSSELAKIYGMASVDFNVTIENSLVFPSEYPTLIEIEGSGLFSNYAPDLRDYVNDVQDLETYDSETYYLVIGLATNEYLGYMPRARNIGFIFEGAAHKPTVIAHEIGHGAFHFRHIFDEEELGDASKYLTNNVMDYSESDEEIEANKDVYLHQWKFIKDPAFVSWFGGDDEEGGGEVNEQKVSFYFWEQNQNNEIEVSSFSTPFKKNYTCFFESKTGNYDQLKKWIEDQQLNFYYENQDELKSCIIYKDGEVWKSKIRNSVLLFDVYIENGIEIRKLINHQNDFAVVQGVFGKNLNFNHGYILNYKSNNKIDSIKIFNYGEKNPRYTILPGYNTSSTDKDFFPNRYTNLINVLSELYNVKVEGNSSIKVPTNSVLVYRGTRNLLVQFSYTYENNLRVYKNNGNGFFVWKDEIFNRFINYYVYEQFFDNEKDAFNYMYKHTEKKVGPEPQLNTELMAFVTQNGVWVSSNVYCDGGSSCASFRITSSNNSIYINNQKIIGIVHSHPSFGNGGTHEGDKNAAMVQCNVVSLSFDCEVTDQNGVIEGGFWKCSTGTYQPVNKYKGNLPLNANTINLLNGQFNLTTTLKQLN